MNQTRSLVVCIDEHPHSLKLIEMAADWARRLNLTLKALYVSSVVDQASGDTYELALAHLEHAKQLGGEGHCIFHHDQASAILEFARINEARMVLLGQGSGQRWKRWLYPSLAQQLLQQAGDLEIHVLPVPKRKLTDSGRNSGSIRTYGLVIVVIMLVTAVLYGFSDLLAEADLIMAYLAVVVILGYQLPRGPALVAALSSVAAFDFFFVPHFFTFKVNHAKYLLTLAVMTAVGFLFSHLSDTQKQRVQAAQTRERQLAALYQLARKLAAIGDCESAVRASTEVMEPLCQARVQVVQWRGGKMVCLWAGDQLDFLEHEDDAAALNEALRNQTVAGRGTAHNPYAKQLYLPLLSAGDERWLLMARPDPKTEESPWPGPNKLYLLETFTSQLALALDRILSQESARESQRQADHEQLRNALLSSVSHDLRTPLGTIMGVSSTLLERNLELDKALLNELLTTIYDEAEHLSRQVNNLMEMTRLASGQVQPKLDWQSPEELIGVVLGRMQRPLNEYQVDVELDDTTLISCDGLLLEVVLANLLDNAVKHSPAGGRIQIIGQRNEHSYHLCVQDQGPGLLPGEEARVFEQFYRSPRAKGQGSGLGLAICKAIIEAHGGRILAINRQDGQSGARFSLILPYRPEPLAHEQGIYDD